MTLDSEQSQRYISSLIDELKQRYDRISDSFESGRNARGILQKRISSLKGAREMMQRENGQTFSKFYSNTFNR